ncbi:MAG: response regulator [Steroidobacteraceae bacterium]
MPGMDGISFLRAAQEVDQHLVGVMMTGHGAIDTAIEAMKAGALDYVLKPFK